LNGADSDPAHIINMRRRKALDVVKLCEKPVRIRRTVTVEFVAGLLAEIRAVHQEEDATGLRVFDEAIGERAGREGFARSGRHVYKRTRLVPGEGLLQAINSFNLTIAHAVRREPVGERHLCEAIT
jgi:hypothetical protein